MIRIVLAEKGLPVKLTETRPWEDEGALAAKNPAGAVPVLIDEPPTGGEIALSPALAIMEYLEETHTSLRLLPSTSAGRAEARRLADWFITKFESEVTDLTVRERIDKRLQRRGQPDYEYLSRGAKALAWHLDYMSWLLDKRPWLAGETYSIADIAAAAQISALDYIGAAPWSDFPTIKEWYARIKSRPSMRPLMSDRIDGVPPPTYYDDLDF